MKRLNLAFDVGHSSIGWAVLEENSVRSSASGSIGLLGCGTVIFRADDCLASSRRAYRRQRRHIRSTRQRIARLRSLFKYMGVLSEEQLLKPGCAWPWLLAARSLREGSLLKWPEMWDVLRWYAHNRGYDGNRRWSTAQSEAEKEDSEKEANARTLMDKHRAKTMAETICEELGVDPLGDKRASMKPYKSLNAAFPRDVVEKEVRALLKSHFGKLRGVDASLEAALLTDSRAIACPGLKLPRRYQGGLLFGQLVPRFDNRIISICPISGKKVPGRNCSEFLNYRWAMQLANVQIARFGEKELSPLSADERRALDQQMRACGAMTADQFKKSIRSITSAIRDNLDTMLMHPDAKEALMVDPVQRLVASDEFSPFWRLLPDRLQNRLRGKWRHGKRFSLLEIRDQLKQLGDVSAFNAELEAQVGARNARARKKENCATREDFLKRQFPVKPFRLDGRASYSRELLKKAHDEVMSGRDPRAEGGCLFITQDMRDRQMIRPIAEQTNNHLIRHRLLILERLVADIVKEYAAGDKSQVSKITLEVNRDLREMSGKTAKEKAQDLGLRIANHHSVAEKLEKAFAEEASKVRITAGMIRKARVAEDLGWRCPYTGVEFEPRHLVTRRVDRDHIVPRSARASDSLESLVITFAAINKWKGNRTAWQFMEQEQGKAVPDLPNLSLMTLSRYRDFVESLESLKGHDEDKRRKKRRKELLLLPAYNQKEFVPRDLTQTSQLVRLGAQSLSRAFSECVEKPKIISLPGSVTGEVRKSWKVLGCLGLANPSTLDEQGDVRTKTEIRDITHLHHALDACVVGLAAHFIPNNGRVWELILKRNPTEVEKRELIDLGVFAFNGEKRFAMRDLSDTLKEQIRQRLAEKRVVQHIPARMDGLRVEQNTWRLVSIKDGIATVQQRTRSADGARVLKRTEEKVGKLLGLEPAQGKGKLQANKGVLVIPENFGLVLDPKPLIIPFHKVWPRMQDCKRANGGKIPRVIRNGQLIRVREGNYKGLWKVFSAKNNATGIALDLGQPDVVRLKNKTLGHKINVLLSSLMKSKMEPVVSGLTGVSASEHQVPGVRLRTGVTRSSQLPKEPEVGL